MINLKNVGELIKAWSKRFKVKSTVLKKKFAAYLEFTAKLHKDKSEKFQQKAALSRLYNELHRRSLPSSYTGIILGETGVEDNIERRRRIATAIFKSDKQRAIKDRWTDNKGVPIDGREFLQGKPNPNFGQSLENVEPEFRRTIYLMDKQKCYSVTSYGDNCKKLDVPKYSKVQFFAGESKAKKQPEGIKLLNLNSNFKILDYASPEEIIDSYGNFEKHINFSEIEKLEGTNVIVAEGSVVSIIVGQTKLRLVLSDPEFEAEDTINAWCLPDAKVDFGEDSRVLFIGQAYKKQGEEGMPTVNLYGMYPLPDFVVPIQTLEINNGKLKESIPVKNTIKIRPSTDPLDKATHVAEDVPITDEEESKPESEPEPEEEEEQKEAVPKEVKKKNDEVMSDDEIDEWLDDDENGEGDE